MINSALEFITLRQSDNKDEQDRATHENADINVWLDIITNYPHFKTWVIQNKTVPVEILEILSTDEDSNIRSDVARKRKINDKIFNLLSIDLDENVRYALMCNNKLTIDQKRTIKMDDSLWLTEIFLEISKNASS